ncbi:hypothetical protein [Gimesia maris]
MPDYEAGDVESKTRRSAGNVGCPWSIVGRALIGLWAGCVGK